MLTLIDKIQETQSIYYIDFLPKKMNTSRYFEIEEFFYDTYLNIFSEKITRIAIKILGYFSTQVCLTVFPDDSNDSFKNLYPIGVDLRNKPIKELAELITHIITFDVSSVQILLEDNSLISINGGFSVEIFTTSDELLQLLDTLIEQENLFLIKD